MKRLNDKRRKKFAREFPGLDQIPVFEWAKRFEVQRVSPFLLQGGGIIMDDHRTVFYVVYNGAMTRLDANVIFDPSSDRRPSIYVRSNGEQIFQISSRPPDFIVEIRSEWDSHGNSIDVCIIYKADKFDWDGYFKRFEPGPEEKFEQFV